MKILRSIAAIIVGIILAVVVIMAAETINGIVYQPDDGRTYMEFTDDLQKDMKAMKAFVESLPQTAMVMVLLGWEVGAFLGGALAALVAGFARRVHAGVVGAFVLAGTAFNFYMMKVTCDITHPDYMILIGLLAPIPASLLGGQLIHMWLPSEIAASSSEGSLRPSSPEGAFKEGESPLRSD